MTTLHHPTHRASYSPSTTRFPAALRQQRIAADRAVALAWRVYGLEPRMPAIHEFFGNWSAYLAAVEARQQHRTRRANLFERAYHRLLAAQLRNRP